MKILKVEYSYNTGETDTKTGDQIICKVCNLMIEGEWQALHETLKDKPDFVYSVSEFKRGLS